MSLLKSHRQVSNLLSPNLKAGPSASSSNTSLNKTYKRPHFFRRLFGGGGYNNTTTTIQLPPIPTIAEATTVSLVKDSIATEVTQENSTINSTSDLAYTVSVWFFFFFFFPFYQFCWMPKTCFLKLPVSFGCVSIQASFFSFFFFFFLFLFFLLHAWFLTLGRKRTAFQVQRNCYLSLRFFKVSFLQA